MHGSLPNEKAIEVLLEILPSFGNIYVFEVKFLHAVRCFKCMQISTEMDVMVGREDSVCHRINLIMM